MKKIILISLVFLISIAVFAYASDMTSSFVFSQESLQSAFQDISVAFNIPVVVDQTVSGNITMNLSNVTLDQAIETICEGYGLFYFKYDGVYFVGTSASALSMKTAAYSEHVIDLKYLSSSDAISFLQPYANYITYSASYPYLFFFGPNNVYQKILSLINSIDVSSNNLYIVYNIYSMSDNSYQIWQNAFSSNYLLPGQFASTNFQFIQQFYNSMKLAGNGFALATVGKNVRFNVTDLSAVAIKMNVKVNSSDATQSNLTLSISTQSTSSSSMQGTPAYIMQANSTVTVGERQMAVASFNTENSHFIITISKVQSAPNTSILTLINDQERKSERNYNLIANYNNSHNTFGTLGNYGNFAFGINYGQNSPLGIYAGIASKLAIGLEGYLLVGGNILSNYSNINAYEGEIALMQYPDLNSNILSSGLITVNASLTAINDFQVKYNGNLEYKIDDIALGGELSYVYAQPSKIQSIDLYGSIGVIYDGGVFRVLYSPLSQNFKFEMNWGG